MSSVALYHAVRRGLAREMNGENRSRLKTGLGPMEVLVRKESVAYIDLVDEGHGGCFAFLKCRVWE